MTVQPKSPVEQLEALAPLARTTAEDFLQAIHGVPDAIGLPCLFVLTPGGGRHIWPSTSAAQLCAISHELAATENVFFSPARFARKERKQAAAAEVNCLWLDIDAGAEKYARDPNNAYPTRESALQAVANFCSALDLAPSFLVSSGEGWHVYFLLSEALPAAEWLGYAERLKAACAAASFTADPVVTADSARVMRLPGTRHKNGRVVRVWGTGRMYAPADLAAKLPPPTQLLELSSRAPGYDLTVNEEVFASRSAHFASVVSGCKALAQCEASSASLPEPLWRAMLGLVKHCADGESLGHKLSEPDPRYSREETQAKIDGWHTGPTTCAQFATHLPQSCTGCPHQGKIKSPIALGYANRSGTGQGAVSVLPDGATLRAVLPDWRRTKDGDKTIPHDTTDNVAALAAAVGVSIRYNAMTRRAEVSVPGLKSERDDFDNAAITSFGDMAVRAGLRRTGLIELINAVAGRSPFHPVAEWIKADPWDGQSRTAQFHESLTLADEKRTGLRASLLDAFMLQGVAACFEPEGVSAQGVLVLNGPQGIGKSRWSQSLCPVPGATQVGVHLDPLDRDSVFQATKSLITELGELGSTTRRADVDALKAFISRPADTLRRPYAATENVYRRRTVFIGTVNGTGFLTDDTGNRRFWVLPVSACAPLEPGFARQLWAEYLDRYQRGERWFLSRQTMLELSECNAAHQVADPLRERIATAFNWQVTERDGWQDEPGNCDWLTATAICIRLGISNPSRSECTRAGAIVSEFNRGASRKSNGAKLLAVPRFRVPRG